MVKTPPISTKWTIATHLSSLNKKKNTRHCKSWFWIGTGKESSTSIWLVICNFIIKGPLVVVIAWYLDLQLPVQSVPIMIKVVSSNPVHGEVYSIQHYVIKFVSELWQVSGFLQILRFPPPIKLILKYFFKKWPSRYNWKWHHVKHHNPNPNHCDISE